MFDMMKHLIHVGFPKTGSTFLQRWFAAHPQLDYAEGGIAGFYNVYQLVQEAARVPSEALVRVTSSECFTSPREDTGSCIIGYNLKSRKSTLHCQLQACEILNELFPNAYILIVTRGFKSMILSSYSQYVRTGGDTSLENLTANAVAGEWRYDETIRFYREAFGAERVIVMPYELLRDNPSQFTRELEHRLGLSAFAPLAERVNASLGDAELCWYPRLTRLVRRLVRVFPGRVRRRVFRLYINAIRSNRLRLIAQILQRLRPAPPVSSSLIIGATLESFRGRANSLRDEPLFAPYASEYLFEV